VTRLRLDRLTELALIGAHCDDIAIGAGATVLQLATANPGLRVRALVLTGADTAREHEERAALAALLPGVELTLDLLGLPDGRLPDHRGVVKDALQSFASGGADLVLGPHRFDAHQDHRLLGEMIPTAFRDHLHLGYEVLKWESDLAATTVYQPVSDELATEKVRVIQESYPSQKAHDWFDDEAFRALMRVRGAQCHHRYAEAFVVEKAVLGPMTEAMTGR
jgi:LmbE family N-acetylglucosaminyl deacetylase